MQAVLGLFGGWAGEGLNLLLRFAVLGSRLANPSNCLFSQMYCTSGIDLDFIPVRSHCDVASGGVDKQKSLQ